MDSLPLGGRWMDEWVFMPHVCTYGLSWGKRTSLGWWDELVRWHCPPDTGLEIWNLVVWGRARYLWVTEAHHNIESLRMSREEAFCFIETWMPERGSNQQAALPLHQGPRPWSQILSTILNLYELSGCGVDAEELFCFFPGVNGDSANHSCPPRPAQGTI